MSILIVYRTTNPPLFLEMARQAINTSNDVAYFHCTYVYFFDLKFTTFTRREYYIATQTQKSSLRVLK